MWARRARRARRARGYVEHVEHVGHVGHMGTLGTAFSRLQNYPAHYVPMLNKLILKMKIPLLKTVCTQAGYFG